MVVHLNSTVSLRHKKRSNRGQTAVNRGPIGGRVEGRTLPGKRPPGHTRACVRRPRARGPPAGRAAVARPRGGQTAAAGGAHAGGGGGSLRDGLDQAGHQTGCGGGGADAFAAGSAARGARADRSASVHLTGGCWPARFAGRGMNNQRPSGSIAWTRVQRRAQSPRARRCRGPNSCNSGLPTAARMAMIKISQRSFAQQPRQPR